jgi:hypothetical protein
VVSAVDPLRSLIQFSRPEPLLFFQVAPHLLSQGLSGPRSTPTGTQKIWQRWDLWVSSQELWPLDNRGGLQLGAQDFELRY